MTKIPNLGVCSIDSFKLRIELSSLKAYDKSLLDTLTTTNPDGEIEQEFKRRSKQYHLDTYSFYASITENVRVDKNRFADCLTVLINSKQIGSRYFEGITKDTIKIAHKKIVELGILDCTLNDFLTFGFPTDIDFKKDYRLSLDEYKELLKVCKTMTKESSNRDKGCTVFDMGISWSVRASNKYLTNPYTKIYHKATELINNSNEFTTQYLNGIDFKDVFRIETTVKNRSHLKRLKLDLKHFNLKELLSLTTEQKDSIIATAINSHLGSRNKVLTFKTQSQMTPTKRQQLNALLILTTELNYSIDRAIKLLLNGIENKVSKSLNKATLNQLYSDHIKGTNYDAKTTQIESVFDSLGWY
jgi:hypothetical protein